MGYSRFSRKHIHGEEPTVATAGINFYDTGAGGDEEGGGYGGGAGGESGRDQVRSGRDGTESSGRAGAGNAYNVPGYGNNRPVVTGGGSGGRYESYSGGSGDDDDDDSTTDNPWDFGLAGRQRYYRGLFGYNGETGIADQMINNQYLNGPVDANGNPTQGYAGQMGGIGTLMGGIAGGVGADGQPTGLQALIQQQQGINSGTADPRFAAYQTAQNDLLATQRQNANTQSSDFFARRGLGGSSAMRNEQMRIGSGYDQQQAALSGNIGLQQMGRQDQAGMNMANLYGQQAGLLGQQAGAIQGAAGMYGTGLDYAGAGLESYLGPETLEISRLAAERAGG